MKELYLKPSIEIEKFDIDIITDRSAIDDEFVDLS